MKKWTCSFTIVEILVVTVIIGLLAAFMIPGYQKSIVKGHERTGTANLISIRGGVELYTVNSGGNIPDMANLAAINSTLNLRIADTIMTYQCWGSISGTTNNCRASHPSGWSLQFNDQNAGNLVHCRAGAACPSCPFSPGNCE